MKGNDNRVEMGKADDKILAYCRLVKNWREVRRELKSMERVQEKARLQILRGDCFSGSDRARSKYDSVERGG